ncbi:MAG: Crp/Fnr family transcriptional regulator [Candidatus Kapabacteria bacterium]|jgi:CRP-like cAMP-binding protein|nr:Crp/Fnr family transcriptional regulator [Candidatus Kapabacteria bacterium]
MAESIEHVLQRTFGFMASMDTADFEAFARRATRETFRKGDVLQREGTAADTMYLLVEGCTIHKAMVPGHEGVIWISQPGDLVCEIYGYFSRTMAISRIVAVTDGVVYSMSHDDVESMYAESHVWERIGRKSLQDYLLRHMRRNMDMQFLSAEDRYASFGERYAEAAKVLPLVDVASFLAIAPETLSRIRSRLK